MARYVVWNRIDPIKTLIGEVLTPEEWIKRKPIAGLDSITPIVAAGEINGAFFDTLGNMIDYWTQRGGDFSACKTSQDYLDAIEVLEDTERAVPTGPSPEERQAQALEAIAEGATSETTEAMMILAGMED